MMARVQRGDTTGYLWVDQGQQRRVLIAEVAPLLPISKTYSFAVPDSLAEGLSAGQRVRVPMGRKGRLVEAFVIHLDRKPWSATLRPIDTVIEDAGHLTPELVELGRQIASHYACPLGQTLKAMSPEAFRKGRGLTPVRYVRLLQPVEVIRAGGKRITAKREKVMKVLSRSSEPMPADAVLREADVSAAVLQGMAHEGWIDIWIQRELKAGLDFDLPLVEPAYSLSAEQQSVLQRVRERIKANAFSATLLFGVSGSGKTEIYIHAMRDVVARGGQAILLVPEIALTTQLVTRLASRFSRVAVSHSGMTEAQRSIVWRQVASGDKSVVIGTRSAVFAPCPNLHLICVDEEQESSYKNLRAPRFHVRDVAILRAKQLSIPVVLGSATPSLELWHNSGHRREYQRVTLASRVRSLPMPKVHLIDMRDEMAELKRPVVLSRTLTRLIGESLQRREQALILINRRGFATRLYCPSCGASVTCPHCNVGMVVHTSVGQSVCHYCRSRMATPKVCPNVGCGAVLVSSGMGTQRIEEVLTAQFPQVHIQRVDSDTMTHKRHYERVVADFESRKIDILVGTQMIAKGLDFPLVSCVGVIQAEPTSLASDFRAEERLFQLITQVAGRAGRVNANGEVVVQTMMPELPSLRFALHHDYESFVARELPLRRRVGLPPFARLTRIVLAHEREQTVREEAQTLRDRIRAVIEKSPSPDGEVLGPNPCPLARLRGRYRYDLLLRTPNASAMRRLLESLESARVLRSRARSLVVDVDPVTLT